MTNEHELMARYLNGEGSLDELPPGLRQEAEQFRAAMRLLGEPTKAPSTLRPAVMQAVRAAARSPWHRTAAWMTTPRLHLSPLTGGLAVAAAVVLLVITRPAPPPPTGEQTAHSATTRFVLVAPLATSVAVTGDFVNWDPNGIVMRDVGGNGVWVAEVELPPGLHYYAFVVNGSEWRPDPNAPSQVDDGFGQQNSVLLVPPRTSS
jgi:hypothetical protein